MAELNISVHENDASFRKNCKQKLIKGKKEKKATIELEGNGAGGL